MYSYNSNYYYYRYPLISTFFEHPLYVLVCLLILAGLFMLYRQSYAIGGTMAVAGVVGLLSLIAWDYFDPLTSKEEKEAKAKKEEEDFARIKKTLGQ